MVTRLFVCWCVRARETSPVCGTMVVCRLTDSVQRLPHSEFCGPTPEKRALARRVASRYGRCVRRTDVRSSKRSRGVQRVAAVLAGVRGVRTRGAYTHTHIYTYIIRVHSHRVRTVQAAATRVKAERMVMCRNTHEEQTDERRSTEQGAKRTHAQRRTRTRNAASGYWLVPFVYVYMRVCAVCIAEREPESSLCE